MNEIVWCNKKYRVENIAIDFQQIILRAPSPHSVIITIKSADILRDIRNVKLQRILHKHASLELSKCPMYYISYDKTGVLIRQMLLKPNKITINNDKIIVESDLWVDKHL